MNNKHQEIAELTDPPIFTQLTCNFVILNLDCFDGTGWAAVFAKTHDSEPLRSAKRLLEEPEPETCLEEWSAH